MENNNKNFEWTKELIKQHLDNNNYKNLNKKDKNSNTAFMVACEHQPKLAEIMLEKVNINLNIQNNTSGMTGFMVACLLKPELAKTMLKRDDISFNIQNSLGDTGFMIACIKQPELMKQMLNNNKIDKNLKNKDGLTGYELAKRYNQESFNIYEAWLAEQEKNYINTQVQKRTKKPSKSL